MHCIKLKVFQYVGTVYYI